MKRKSTNQFVWIILAIFIPFVGMAQKPNTKNVQIKFVQPPAKPLNEGIKTYYSNVINTTAGFSFSTESAKDKIRLIGYELANSQEDADILLELSINSVNYESSIRKVKWKKKINDSTYIDKVGGAFTVTANMNVTYYVKDLKTNSKLTSGNKTHTQSFESKRFDTYNAAVYASNESKGAEGRKLYSTLANTSLSRFNNHVNDQFGFPIKNSLLPVARGKGKKFDYTDLGDAYEKFVNVNKQMNNGELTDDAAAVLKECVFTWEKATKEYVPGKKKTRIGDKNIGHIRYNIALGKFLLRDFDGALQVLDQTSGTKVNKTNVSTLTNLTNHLKERHSLQK